MLAHVCYMMILVNAVRVPGLDLCPICLLVNDVRWDWDLCLNSHQGTEDKHHTHDSVVTPKWTDERIAIKKMVWDSVLIRYEGEWLWGSPQMGDRYKLWAWCLWPEYISAVSSLKVIDTEPLEFKWFCRAGWHSLSAAVKLRNLWDLFI